MHALEKFLMLRFDRFLEGMHFNQDLRQFTLLVDKYLLLCLMWLGTLYIHIDTRSHMRVGSPSILPSFLLLSLLPLATILLRQTIKSQVRRRSRS